jgi:hypothetical protein
MNTRRARALRFTVIGGLAAVVATCLLSNAGYARSGGFGGIGRFGGVG